MLLQQASDATGGVYMKPERPEGILQYLMMGFLPDATARRVLIMPSAGGVDFRAACFCHRKVVDVGFVCSVCLSSKSSLSTRDGYELQGISTDETQYSANRTYPAISA